METTSLTLSWFDLLTNAITSDNPTEKCTKQFRKGKTLPTHFFARVTPFSYCNQRNNNKNTYLNSETLSQHY